MNGTVTNMSKAENKHHEKRLKKKRSKYMRCEGGSEKRKGKVYQTPAECSCFVCRHPKKPTKGMQPMSLEEYPKEVIINRAVYPVTPTAQTLEDIKDMEHHSTVGNAIPPKAWNRIKLLLGVTE